MKKRKVTGKGKCVHCNGHWIGNCLVYLEFLKNKDMPLEGMSDLLIVNTIGSERSKIEVDLKYMWYLKLGYVREIGRAHV